MKKSIIILFISFSCLFNAEAHKQYYIDSVAIEAQIRPDGSMRISESRLYKFQGSFSYVFRVFPKQEEIRFRNFEASIDGKPLPQSNQEKEGHFVVINKQESIEVGWAFSAENEAKVFTLSYEVENIIQRHEDVAVLYYKFIDRAWTVPQGNVNVHISYQKEMKGEVLHWLHGPAHAYSTIDNQNQISLLCEKLPKNNFLEVRALFPSAWFAQTPMLNSVVKGDIVEEEKAWMEADNKRRLAAQRKEAAKRKVKEHAPYIILMIYLLFGGLAFWIWRNFRTEKAYVQKPKGYVMNPPSDLHPAVLNYLIYGQLLNNELKISMFDLARKKVLKIDNRNEGKSNDKKLIFWVINREQMKVMADSLLDFEKLLIAFVFGDLSGGTNEISFKELPKNSRKWQLFATKFNKSLSTYAKSLEIWDKRSTTGRNWIAALAFFTFILFFPGMFLLGMPAVLILTLSLLLFMMIFVFRQRKDPYQEEFYQWMAYKKYLKDSAKKKTDLQLDHDVINDHLLYSIAFGFSKTQLDRIIKQLPEDQFERYFYWYTIHPGNRSNPQLISQSIGNMAGNLASSPVGNPAGSSGGGASFSGGGGGFSAGGGGAR